MSDSCELIEVENATLLIEIEECGSENTLIEINEGNVTISGAQEIDDNVISTNRTYSSVKIEDRIDEEVGDDDFDFVLLFENQLSM